MSDDTPKNHNVQAENAQLRRRITELEQRLQEVTQKAADVQTQLQQIQQELQQSQSTLTQLQAEAQRQQVLVQLLIDHLPQEIGVYWKDHNGCYLGGNRKMYTDAGASTLSEIVGKTDYDMPWADRADVYRADDRAVMINGIQQLYEEAVTSSDGSTLWVVSTKVPWVYNGQVLGIVGIAEDRTKRKQQEAQLRTFKILVENTPDAVMISDPHQIITYANAAAEAMYGFQPTLVGVTSDQLVVPTERLLLDQLVEEVMRSGTVRIQLRAQRASGAEFPAQLSGLMMRDDQGQLIGFGSVVRDLTEEQRAIAERQALQEQIIAAQQKLVRELSTPLMPIADGVVVMPIIGSVDSQRAQAIMETTLEGITTYSAEVVILDITGVRVVDTQVAAALLRTARAAQLLGSEVVLTGISAEIAQTLVQIGANLGNIIAQSSLQQGIAYAMHRRKALVHSLR